VAQKCAVLKALHYFQVCPRSQVPIKESTRADSQQTYNHLMSITLKGNYSHFMFDNFTHEESEASKFKLLLDEDENIYAGAIHH
jgi:hypothetical protein